LTAVYVAENVTVNQAMTMDIFFPEGDALAKRPFVILAYGGGYLFGTKEDEDVWATCDSLAKKGYVAASINYRMNMNVASSVSAVRAIYRAAQDYHAAIRYIKEYADTYRVDTNYMFVGGVSAGGFSAMHAVYMDENERPAETFQSGLLGANPDLGCLSCSGNSFNHTNHVRGIINLWGALMDTSYVQQNEVVPMTLFHGTDDLIVPYDYGFPFTALFLMPEVFGSANISMRVNNLGGTAELNTFAGVGHNIWGVNVNNQLVGGPTEHWSPITDSIISFLYENIRPEQALLNIASSSCSADTATFEVLNPAAGGWVCWDVENGTIVAANSDSSVVQVVWQNAGNHQVTAVSFNHLQAYSIPNSTQVSVYISPQVSITDLGGSLQASGSYPSYQWYLNGNPIPDANQQNYTPLSTGTYTVEASTANGCSAFSGPLLLVGLESPRSSGKIVARIEVLDIQGRLIGKFGSIEELRSAAWSTTQTFILRYYGADAQLISEEKRVLTTF
jgi:predicted esterase